VPFRYQKTDIRSQNHGCGKLSSQKTLRDPRRAASQPHAVRCRRNRGFACRGGGTAFHRIPLRSHNSLLYDCHQQRTPASQREHSEGNFLLRAASRKLSSRYQKSELRSRPQSMVPRRLMPAVPIYLISDLCLPTSGGFRRKLRFHLSPTSPAPPDWWR